MLNKEIIAVDVAKMLPAAFTESGLMHFLERVCSHEHILLNVEANQIPRHLRQRFTELIFENADLSLYFLCWDGDLPGTPIHDHAASAVALSVFDGEVCEVTYNGAEQHRVLRAGESVYHDPSVIHEVRDEDGLGRSISLHAYSPALTCMNFYTSTVGGFEISGRWNGFSSK